MCVYIYIYISYTQAFVIRRVRAGRMPGFPSERSMASRAPRCSRRGLRATTSIAVCCII